MKEPIPIKILDMRYDQQEKVFLMTIFHKEKEEKLVLVIRLSDFGIPEDTPLEIIDFFCKEMEGKEKNLYVNIDQCSYKEGMFEDASIEELYHQHDKLEEYPYREMNRIERRERKNE